MTRPVRYSRRERLNQAALRRHLEGGEGFLLRLLEVRLAEVLQVAELLALARATGVAAHTPDTQPSKGGKPHA